jgi:hypothetical protein
MSENQSYIVAGGWAMPAPYLQQYKEIKKDGCSCWGCGLCETPEPEPPSELSNSVDNS